MTDVLRAPRYAVITTHNRPAELNHIVAQLLPQADHIVVIDNASTPPVGVTRYGPHVLVLRDEQQPPNLYRLWNVGLDAVKYHVEMNTYERWDVGIFNDDADVPFGWYDIVTHALRSGPYAAASTGSHRPVDAPHVATTIGGALYDRMCPWAFVTRGELGLRADERFGWWWGDTDFEWTCRLNGGVIAVPGPLVPNTLANSTTHGELAVQAGRDGETFAQKWGFRPW